MVAAISEVEHRRRSSWAKPAALGMTAFGAVLIVAWVGIAVTMPGTVPSDDASPAELILVLPLITMGSVGLLLTARMPANPVGWLLGVSVVVLCLLLVGTDYADHWLYVHDLPSAFLVPLGFAGTLGWAAGFPILLVVLPLIFPDGHLLSRRWRMFVWLTVAVAVAAIVSTVFDPQAITDNHRYVHNPLGIAGAHDFLYLFSNDVSSAGLIGLMAVGVVAVVIRYRRADPDLRQQLKWFLAAVSVAVGGMVVAFATNFSAVGFVAVAIGFTALPLSIGIAVLKYRLYNIDVVVNRAVLFATMAVFITAVYVAIVVGIGALVGSTGRPNVVLSVAATAIVGLAFQPVLARARRVANRLVYGNRATPYEVLSDLSQHLVDTYSGDDLLPRIARSLAEATAATRVEVLLRVGSIIKSAAVWPPGTAQSATTTVTGQQLPVIPGFDHVVPVVHQAELLGAFALAKRNGESLSPLEDKLVADLAAQAGLMLKNMGLTADLQARLEDLRASRQRLVGAQDAERRRIERNLHDGAQQNLVALKVKLGLLELVAKKDPEKAAALASEVKADADEALQTLRDLARGIYPPLLADQGLVAAIQAQTRKAALPVDVSADGVLRYPQELEAAVYFCCLEALQNVAKYAAASRASVHISVNSGRLEFVVRDDGAGFDPQTTPLGSGLTNMADRIDALGGDFAITSSPGTGTQVKGSLPAPATKDAGAAPPRR